MSLKARLALLCLGAAGVSPASAAAVFPLATVSSGSVPSLLNYQGRLSDGGLPVENSRAMTFRIYDAPAGGALLWSQGPFSVNFEHGFFNVGLAVSAGLFTSGQPRYLEAQVDAFILAPRDPLTAAPYALVAKSVEGSLDVSHGGLAVSTAASGLQSLYVSSQTGLVGLGTSNPQSVLDVRGVIGGGGPSGLAVAANGNVGVSTAAPASPLSIAGDLRLLGGGQLLFPTGGPLTTALVACPPNPLAVCQSINSPRDAVLIADSQNSGTGDVVLNRGALPSDVLRALNGGSVGIGSTHPGARLHLSSGTLIVDGIHPALLVGLSDFSALLSSAGIGTASPVVTLDVGGAAQFGSGPAKSTFTAAGLLALVSGSTVSSAGTLSLAGALFFDGQGRTGAGTLAPALPLDVSGSARFGASGQGGFSASGNLQFSGASWVTSNGSLTISTAATAGVTGDPAIFLSPAGQVGLGSQKTPSRLSVVNNDVSFSTTAGAFGLVFQDGSVQTVASGAGQWRTDSSVPPNTLSTGRADVSVGGPGLARLDIKEPNPLNPFALRASSGPADYRLAVLTSGRVGIGVSSPADLLQLGGGHLLAGPHPVHDLAPAESLFVSGNAVYDGAAVVAQGSFTAVGVAAAPGAALMNVLGAFGVLANGNAGAGTVSPAGPLSVAGSAALGNSPAMASFGGNQWLMQVLVGDAALAGLFDYGASNSGSLNIYGAGAAAGARKIHLWDNLSMGYSLSGQPGGSAVFSGKVGVGVASPVNALDINGLVVEQPGSTGGVFFNATGIGIGTTSPGSLLSVAGTIVEKGGAAGVTLNAAGDVGIVNSNPAALLQAGSGAFPAPGVQAGIDAGIVTGSSITASDATNQISLGVDGSASAALSAGAGDPLIFKTNNAEKARLTTGGNLGVGTTAPVNAVDVQGALGWGPGAPFSAFTTAQGGSLELGGNNSAPNPVLYGVPYIDFHYGTGAGTQDYNVRIQNSADGELDVDTQSNGTILTVNGRQVGLGTANPGAALEVNAANALRLRAAASGSLGLFAAVTAGAQACSARCAAVSANAACLGGWSGTGTSVGCADATSGDRCLCAGFGD